MKKSVITVVCAALSVVFANCSHMPKTIEKPDVALQGLDIQKASLTDATVLLKLEVRNPNPFKIDVDGLKYGLNIDGKSFANGKFTEGTTLAANGDTEITVPLRMKYWDIFTQFSDLMKKKESVYEIIGTLTSGGRDFQFDHKGDVKLPIS